MKTIFFVSKKNRVLPQEIGDKLMTMLKPEMQYFAVIPEDFQLDSETSTYELLRNDKIQSFIKNNSDNEQPNILVFKNTDLVQKMCRELNYNLLAADAQISSFLENKISQAEFFQEFNIPRPFTVWGQTEDMDFYRLATKLKLPFILQFGRGHTGQGTKLIYSEEDYKKIQKDFPFRDVRCSEYLKGETGTINLCLTDDGIILGAPSIQLTGIEGLTKNKLSTVGNDWGYIRDLFIGRKLEKQFLNFIDKIENAVRKIGYRGIFGIDFVITENNRDHFSIIEINARFPASTATETEMAIKAANPILLAYHLKEFIPEIELVASDYKNKIPYYKGSKIIYRDEITNEEKDIKLFSTSMYLGKSKLKCL